MMFSSQIVFGEGLPSRFFKKIPDLQKADLLIVLGTSLQVQPFASLIDRVPDSCPRLLINLERVGEIASYGSSSSSGLDKLLGGMRGTMNESGFDFEGWTLGKGRGKEHIRDVFYEGKCDEGILELAKGTGWEKELLEKHRLLIERIDKENKTPSGSVTVTAEESADNAAKKMAEDTKSNEKEVSKANKASGDSADNVAEKLDSLKLADPSKEGATTTKAGSTSSL